MSRIFEKPRYKNQARNKILAIATASNSIKAIRRVCELFNLNKEEIDAMNINYDFISELYLDGVYNDEDLPKYESQLEEYLLEAELTAKLNKVKLMSPTVALKVVRDIISTFEHFSPMKIYNDTDALFYLIKRFLNDMSPVSESKESKVCRRAAYNLLFYQLMPQKIAPGMFKEVYEESCLSKKPPDRCIRADEWIECTEKGIYFAHSMWVKYCRIHAMNWQKMRAHTKNMVEKASSSMPWERYLIDTWVKAMPESKTYNYNGILITYIEDICLIMDNSLYDNARAVFTSIRNSEIAFSNYRMTGDAKKYELYGHYCDVLNWIKNNINLSHENKNEYLARHMHLSYIAWQNITCEEKARFDCGAKERNDKLKKDILEVYPHDLSFFNMIMSFPIDERQKCELLKMYHILPPPDIDPKLLHEELINKSNNTNSYNKESIKEFINFCKAYDFSRLVAKTHELPSYKSEPGYEFLESNWMVKCLSGKFKMPPEEDWGKISISCHFPYEHSSDFHIFDAKDVTRVVADLDFYMSRTKDIRTTRFETNELLSALFNGSKLSNGLTMCEWREKVMNGKLTEEDFCLAIEAGKSENTKPGKKVRETLSGSDNVREFLTEVDHSLRPLAQITPGVSIRMDAIKHKRKFQNMAHSISHYSSKLGFATSTDISGWSPKMPRYMFHAWQDYALATTTCKNPTAVREIWNKMIAVVDRRGYKAFSPYKDGTFQGWPATSDTTMHAHILIYWAYKLRNANILSDKEAAYTLCLIDDAATVVAMEGDYESASSRALKAKDMLRELYSDLGFEMDDVKSYFSSIKFVYLNELYIDGAQVMHSVKTIMRIAKDNRRRFASLTDHISTLFGMSANAANQGSCPFLSYWLSAWLSYRLVYKTYEKFFKLGDMPLFLASIASPGMNGLGMKLITSVMSTGQNDSLTWFLEVYSQYLGYGVDEMIEAILAQDTKYATPYTIFKNPYGYEISDHSSASSHVMKKFRECARSKGLAEPFKTLEKFDYDVNYEKSIEYVIKNGTYEASVLQEVSMSTPEAFIDELMSRIERTELIVCLLDSKSISSLRRHIRNSDVKNLQNMFAAASRRMFLELKETRKLKELGSFLYAKELRNRRLNGYQILNHTYPCPFSLWAFNGHIDLESETAQRVTTLSFNKNLLSSTFGSASVNLYDSIPFHIGYKGYKSISSSIASEEKILLYNPVRKKIARGLSILRWARENGSAYLHLLDLFMWCWGGFCDFRMLDLPGALQDSSIKRLSIRHNKANHVISMYPNSQSAVRVNAKAITRAQANTHHLFDVMSAITTLRTSGLLEASLAMKKGITSFAYSFLYKVSSVAIVELPLDQEVDSFNPHLQQITPFVKINCDFSEDAKKLCSFKVMSETLRRATEISDKAAVEYFEDAQNTFDIDFDEWSEHTVAAEKIRIIHTARTYDELTRRTTLVLADHKPKYTPHPIVREEKKTSNLNSGLMVDTACLNESESIKLFAQQLNDTAALHLCSNKPRFANVIHYAWKLDNIDDVLLVENYAESCKDFLISINELVNISHTLDKIAPMMERNDRCSEFMYHLGLRGCRISKDCTEIVPSMHSYMGTAAGHMQRMTAIAKSIDKFQPKGEEKYSIRKMIGDHVAQYNIGDIFKATWRLAAARYESQAEERAKRRVSSEEVFKLNYKALFIRCFSNAVSSVGTISDKSALFLIYSAILESIINHMGRDDLRRNLTEDLKVNNLLNIDCIDDEDDLWDVVEGMAELARKYKDDVYMLPIKGVYDEVRSWINEDCKGVIEKTTLISKFRVSKIKKDAPPVVFKEAQKPDVTQPVISSTPVFLGSINLSAPIDICPLTSTSAEISGMTELDYAAPHDIMEWLTGKEEILEMFACLGYSNNTMVFYNTITSSKKEWENFLRILKNHSDSKNFITPEYSRFECRYLEDLENQDNWMAE